MTLFLLETAHGKGVGTNAPISAGTEILSFTGPIVHRSQLPEPYDDHDDHYVQIDRDHYMGPSGQLDDFVNHSCSPNAGLRVTPGDVTLVAIRDIAANEEITWDYSTTMEEDEWEMDCHCGSPVCRRIVRDFKHLDPVVQQRYLSLGVVPRFVLEGMEERRK